MEWNLLSVSENFKVFLADGCFVLYRMMGEKNLEEKMFESRLQSQLK